jgi:hypothetical protein
MLYELPEQFTSMKQVKETIMKVPCYLEYNVIDNSYTMSPLFSELSQFAMERNQAPELSFAVFAMLCDVAIAQGFDERMCFGFYLAQAQAYCAKHKFSQNTLENILNRANDPRVNLD